MGGALTHNIDQIRRLVGPSVSIFVCMKNDAIGCGVERIAQHCESVGVDGLALDRIEKAISCRASGVTLPILLYPSCLPEAAPLVEAMNIMPTISTLEDVAN
jgi:alanine racemase